MTYCTKCGGELGERDQFCPTCGTAVAPQPETATETAKVTAQEPAFTQAGLARRISAHLIDLVVVFVMFWIIGSWVAGQAGGVTETGFELEDGPAMLVILLTVGASMAYFAILEAYWYGQTLGKKLFGIRVTGLDGERAGLGATIIRNLMRIVDVIPFYLIGVISIAASDRDQRVGDRLARTMVIKAKPAKARVQEKASAEPRGRIRFSMGKSDFID